MPTPESAGKTLATSLDPNGLARFHHRPRHDMVICPLICLKNKPTGRAFASNRTHRFRQHAGVVPANPEKDRTRRVRGDHHVVVVVIVVVERRREPGVHLFHRPWNNLPPGPPTGFLLIAKDLLRPDSRPPRGCRKGPDDASPILVSADNR